MQGGNNAGGTDSNCNTQDLIEWGSDVLCCRTSQGPRMRTSQIARAASETRRRCQRGAARRFAPCRRNDSHQNPCRPRPLRNGEANPGSGSDEDRRNCKARRGGAEPLGPKTPGALRPRSRGRAQTREGGGVTASQRWPNECSLHGLCPNPYAMMGNYPGTRYGPPEREDLERIRGDQSPDPSYGAATAPTTMGSSRLQCCRCRPHRARGPGSYPGRRVPSSPLSKQELQVPRAVACSMPAGLV